MVCECSASGCVIFGRSSASFNSTLDSTNTLKLKDIRAAFFNQTLKTFVGSVKFLSPPSLYPLPHHSYTNWSHWMGCFDNKGLERFVSPILAGVFVSNAGFSVPLNYSMRRFMSIFRCQDYLFCSKCRKISIVKDTLRWSSGLEGKSRSFEGP